MAAARLSCKRAIVGTGWANSCPGCINKLRKHYSHLVGGAILARKAAWALSGCLPTENSLMIRGVVKVTSLLILPERVHLSSVLESELRQK